MSSLDGNGIDVRKEEKGSHGSFFLSGRYSWHKIRLPSISLNETSKARSSSLGMTAAFSIVVPEM